MALGMIYRGENKGIDREQKKDRRICIYIRHLRAVIRPGHGNLVSTQTEIGLVFCDFVVN